MDGVCQHNGKFRPDRSWKALYQDRKKKHDKRCTKSSQLRRFVGVQDEGHEEPNHLHEGVNFLI